MVTNSSLSPFTRAAYRNRTASNHPHRRIRPVFVPRSWPFSLIWVPAGPVSSVGNGPEPTRVTYALVTPITRSTSFGPRPLPARAPPATGLDEVTNG